VTLRSRLATAASNPDFVAITIFCAIGLLAMGVAHIHAAGQFWRDIVI
jgi:hypothetical protein